MLSSIFRFYRAVFSPDHSPLGRIFFPGGGCRHEPSCSFFTENAIRIHGFFRGVGLGAERIFFCRPGKPAGFWPVPPRGARIADAVRAVRDFLKSAEIPRPDLDAELLAGEVLGFSREKILARGGEIFPVKKWGRLWRAALRRAAGESVAAIRGRREFFSRDFSVPKNVLVPRPETEILVERVLRFFEKKCKTSVVLSASEGPAGDFQKDPSAEPQDDGSFREAKIFQKKSGEKNSRPEAAVSPATAGVSPDGAAPDRGEAATEGSVGRGAKPPSEFKILEIGPGSGAIAVTLAAEIPGAEILAVDRSRAAVRATRANAQKIGVAGRVRVALGDLFSPVPPGEKFRAVVSNPPYLRPAELAEFSIRAEPRCALDGGPDGLDFYRRILAGAGDFLEPSGGIFLEIGANQAAAVAAISERFFPGAKVEISKDLAGRDRVVGIFPAKKI